ncbi:MAG: sigma-70 family RNA polymerase sigma factor [Phycisphaeraceae bacterium]|nr:sigma-70 family RNA polymerase sigma factor [Phycisphaeraceae bacterium]
MAEAKQPVNEDEVAGLLAAASAGDEAAWRDIIARYSKRVFALAKSRCQRTDLAEEVTQSVFATVAMKLGSGGYSERGRFESWLFRVAMNRIRDEMRRLKRHADPTDPAVLGGSRAAPESGVGVDEATLAKLRVAMEQLPDADREIVELRHHGQMSFREMSEMLGEPLGTLLARHHRALKKLKQLMGEEGEDES